MVKRNCCSFCEVFLKEIGAEPLPAWINRLAKAGASVATAVESTTLAAKSLGKELDGKLKISENASAAASACKQFGNDVDEKLGVTKKAKAIDERLKISSTAKEMGEKISQSKAAQDARRGLDLAASTAKATMDKTRNALLSGFKAW